MYNSYFGFREKPFKLVPNPDYLFLSKSHEVSLAHLSYATDQGDGFVVITGEVGTGKTTLCRIFLERLDNETESAYIFNPNLDSIQLLTVICNEFGIKTNLPTVKSLLDVLNSYLIMKNKDGRNVILLIDEAQNLTVENLELVRMLSNLETTRSKLLQIILVGQPELSDKLDSYELRQLAQRISLRCHLTPLLRNETKGYIRHRVNVAAHRNLELFSAAACRKIYQYSGGIPRLINIASDRALLSAYSLNRKKISGAVASTAIKELSKQRQFTKQANGWRYMAFGAMACLVCFAIGIWVVKSDLLKNKPVQNDSASTRSIEENTVPTASQTYKIELPPKEATSPPASDPKDDVVVPPQGESQPNAANGIAEESSLKTIIGRLDPVQSRLDAVAALLSLWKQPKPNTLQLPVQLKDDTYFDIAARQYGLRAYRVPTDWTLIQQMNLPCILALQQKNTAQTVFITMMSWKDGRIMLGDGVGEKTIEVELDEILPYLHGEVYLFWKNVTGFDFIIGAGADANAIMVLKTLLERIGYGPFENKPVYDARTRQAIIEFQSRSNIKADGLVGPLTKIMLINAAKAYNVPQLNPQEGTGA